MNRLFYCLVVLMGIVKLTTPLPFIPSLTLVWIGLVALCLVLAMVKDRVFTVSLPLLSFCIVVLVGLVIKRPPAYYRSYERFIAFVINVMFLSPLLVTPTLLEIRQKLFKVILWGLRLIVFASFIAYLLGINLAQRSEANAFNWGFGGITGQSMILAPCCAICIIDGVWHFMYKQLSDSYKIAWGILLAMALWLVVAAGSRGSLGACVCALMVLVYFVKQKQKVIMRALFITIIVVVAMPQSLFDEATFTINRKQNSAARVGSITSSRDAKWEARWAEFTEDPVLGVGFGAQTHFTGDDDMKYIQKTGGLEPGSAWLCVLSMTGFLGFLAIFIFNAKLAKDSIFLAKDDFLMPFYLSCLTFFFIHGFIEGWILYAGSYIFCIYWLLTGTIHSRIVDNGYK